PSCHLFAPAPSTSLISTLSLHDALPICFVAADLIAQAEHSPGASILVTWHAPLLNDVATELERQLATLPRGHLARESLERFGAIDRKSTRLNSSHQIISYAVFCLKKKKK